MTTKPKEKAPAASDRQSWPRIKIVLPSLVLLGLALVALPTVTIVVVGLLPAFTWLIVDTTPGRYGFRCIASMNVAGVVPFVYQLWMNGNDLPTAIAIVSEPLAWLVFMCAAASGWLVFYVVPGLVTAVQKFNARQSIRELRRRQEELVEEWGPSVAGPARKQPQTADSEAEEKETSEA